MNDDGISYLDMALAYFRGDWKMAINAYWSPLYSWLVGLPLAIFRPSPQYESSVVQMVNLAIYLVSLVCFEFFMRAFLRWQKVVGFDDAGEPLPQWCWWMLGYTLFFYSSLSLIGVNLVTPDLCVAALVYLAAGILLRIRGGEAHWLLFAVLGVVLGISYLTKAVMFPLAFVFLAASLWAAGSFRRGVLRALLATIVFLLMGAPFIAAISKQKGRLTYGDTGRIAYAVFVTEGLEGQPKHPLRKLRDAPAVFEFAAPIGGTYPPWYDNSYWLDGFAPRFRLDGELRVLRQSAERYFELLAGHREFLVGFLALFLFMPRKNSFVHRVIRESHYWLPAAAAFVLYALVHVEPRFLGAFLVLLWMALFSGLRLPQSPESRRWVRCITIAVVLTMGARLTKTAAAYDAVHILRPAPNLDGQVAKDLHRLGIAPGDQVAVIGHPTRSDYWAHLARLKIVAEVPAKDVPLFWAAGTDVQAQILEMFAQSGAKAVVTDALPADPSSLPPDWEKLGNTGYFVRVVQGRGM